MSQVKEQYKSSGKQLNEVEIGNFQIKNSEKYIYMESKQLATKKPMSQQRNYKGNLKTLRDITFRIDK